MTTVTESLFPELESDERWNALVHIVGHDWLYGEEEFARFVAALFRCRRGPADEIHVDDVRRHFLEDTIRGRRIDIDPHRYSAYWQRAHAEKIVDYARTLSPTVGIVEGPIKLERITESTSGNNGKWMPVRVWRGGVS